MLFYEGQVSGRTERQLQTHMCTKDLGAACQRHMCAQVPGRGVSAPCGAHAHSAPRVVPGLASSKMSELLEDGLVAALQAVRGSGDGRGSASRRLALELCTCAMPTPVVLPPATILAPTQQLQQRVGARGVMLATKTPAVAFKEVVETSRARAQQRAPTLAVAQI